MAESIDRVQIDIEANAIGTTRVFKQLEEHINIVKKALDTINVSKLVQAQKAINNANINSDALGMSKAEQNIKNSVNSIKASLAGLGAYANAAMNGDKSSYTSFERRVISIQSAIDVLKEKMAQLGNVRVPTPAMDSIQKQMEDTKSALESFERKAQEMRDTGKNVTEKETYVEVLHALRDAALEFDRLKAKQDELTNSGKAWIYPMDEYKNAVDRASASLSDMTSKVRGAIPKETKEEAKETAQEVGNIFKAHKDSHLLLKALKNIHKAMSSLRHATIDAGKNGFMKLLKYGLGIRSVYVLFRRLRKVVTDSFGDLQKSGAFFETTAANVLALRTALVTLKFQFGAAFEPIFNAVAPALEKFINDLITAMNALSAFTARLMGQSTYSKVQMVTLATEKAAKNAKELNKQLQKFDELNNLTTNKNGSGNTGKTDDHAVYTTATVDSALGDFGKRLADQLRAGDWAGVGQTISDKLVEELKGINWEDIKRKAGNIGQKFADFFNSLLNPELLSEVGHAIGEALNSALTFFNEWGKGLHFEDIGRALAEGLNAWVKTGNLALLGETLHTWLAGGLDLLIGLIDQTDFEELGKQIAEFIGNLDIPDLVGKLLKLAWKILEGLADAIKGLWNNSSILGKLAEAIIGILLLLKFGGKLGGLAALIMKALADGFGSGGILGAIGNLIGTSIAGKTVTVAASGFAIKLTGAGLILSGAAILGGTALASSVQNNPFDFDKNTGVADWSKLLVGTGLTSTGIASGAGLLAKLAGGGFGATFAKVFPAAAGIVGAQWGGSYAGNKLGKEFFGTVLNDKEMESYYKQYQNFGINPITTAKGWGEILGAIGDGTLVKAWNELWGDVGEAFYDFQSENYKAEKSWLDNVLEAPKKRISNVGKWFKETGKQWGDTMETIWTPVFDLFSDDYLGGMLKDLTPEVTSIGQAWNMVSGEINKTTTEYIGLNSITDSLSGKTKELVKRTNQFGNESQTSSKKFSDAIKGLPSKVQSVFSDAYSSGTKTWSNLGSWAIEKVKDIENGTKQLPSKTSTDFETAYNQSTSKWRGVYAWAQNTFDKIPNAAKEKLGAVESQFSQNFESATSQAKTKVSSFNDWFKTLKFEKKAYMSADEASFSSTISKYTSLVSTIKDKKISISVEGKGFSAITSQINTLTNKINSLTKSTSATFSSIGSKATSLSNQLKSIQYAQSQQHISNSSSSSVKKFATGGIVSGATRAIVGEAGPEAIIPLTDGTLGSLSKLIVGEMVKPQVAQISSPTYSAWGSGDSSVSEQNALLREEVALLRQIAGKELTISSSEVFKATQAESNNYYNRTGNSPFLF